MEQQLKDIISACDLAIQNEDFDTLMNYYSEDDVLVVKPGMIARGKEEIKKAFITIANDFNHHIVPTQGKMWKQVTRYSFFLRYCLIRIKSSPSMRWKEGRPMYLRRMRKASGFV
ncbi:hypothetical protein SC09_Contig28orf00288 [Bacillus subtilis]|uniref:SnoaL-like domain-containing protein n=1 Tax=Bacillus subtilis TaxID=1423 RepID=A0A0D1KMT8_BACIU|nr:hypothetical protein SC09_Contig28orf00288 [Bacillus subtilis]